MERDGESHRKYIVSFPTPSEVERARHVFITRYVAQFFQKHKKYVTLLKEHGVSIPEAFSTCSVNFCVSFEEEIDIIVSEKRRKIKDVCKINGVYRLTNLFGLIYQIVRRTRASRIEIKLLDISREDLIETLNDIASELAFAYEYQIIMLNSENDVRLLADHAVSCTMNFLKQSDASFNRCKILEAITDVFPKKSFTRGEKVVTRIMKTDNIKGTRQQKWRLSEIFKQPGLRMPKTNGNGYTFYGCFTPYGSLCRPEKYGFRGPIHVWDETLSQLVLLYNDQISVNVKHGRKIERNTKCIHQNYEPAMLCLHSELQQVPSEPDDCVISLNDRLTNELKFNDHSFDKDNSELLLPSENNFNSEPAFKSTNISNSEPAIPCMFNSTNKQVSSYLNKTNTDPMLHFMGNSKSELVFPSKKESNSV